MIEKYLIRSKVDAVIIGCNTLIKDNPMLNVRINDFGEEIKNVLKESRSHINGRDNFFLAELLKTEITDYKDRSLWQLTSYGVSVNFSLSSNYSS